MLLIINTMKNWRKNYERY